MMTRTLINNRLPLYQRGAATLLIALIVMTTVTLVTLYTSRTVLMEKKMATNDYRSRVAFEAAEAGMEAAVAYIQGGRDRDNDGALPAEVDASGTDISDTNEFLFTTTNTLTLANGSQAVVTLLDRSIPNEQITSTEIVSVGWSDDKAATRTVVQLLTTINALPNIPENPLLTRGTAVISGSADVFNPEGHSTIWSGGPVDLGGSATVNTFVANPADANYPNCLGDALNPCSTTAASSSGQAGLDVVEQDSSLNNLTDDEFFENFFGMTPTEYRNSVVTMDLDPATDNVSTSVHLATNPEVIWVDGNVTLSANTIVGCSVAQSPCPTANISPVIMIVDGVLTMQGNADFYGMLYVTGGTAGHGNPTSVGSIVIAGDTSNLTGSFSVTYNSDVLERAGMGGRPAASSGSWHDF